MTIPLAVSADAGQYPSIETASHGSEAEKKREIKPFFDQTQLPGGPAFTEKQDQYLAFIWAYTCIHRRPPAEADMQRHFNVTAPSVHQMVLTLEKAGLIERQPGVPRSIRVAVNPKYLPILLPAVH